MSHWILSNPRQYMSRYACRHALRKAHDSSNETHNRAICINDAPPDSESPDFLPASSSSAFLISFSSSSSSFVSFLATIYRFCTIAPLDADMARDHVRRLLISLVNAWKYIWKSTASPILSLVIYVASHLKTDFQIEIGINISVCFPKWDCQVSLM